MTPPVAAEVAAQAVSSGPGQPTWAIFISAGAILIAATIGAFWQRRIARQTLTFNTIERQIWDNDFINARRGFVAVRNSKTAAELTLLSGTASSASSEASDVRSVLNNYEVISLGISVGVLDSKIYKRYHRTSFVEDYERMKPFIDGVKSRNAKAYVEYTALYEKWRSK